MRSQQYKVPIIGCIIGSNLVTPKCPGATSPKGDSIWFTNNVYPI